MTDFFTADWNLNHYNIIKYCNRPFTSTDEMNETLIENCNARVKEDDRLFFVGGFLFGPLSDEKFLRTARYFRRKINCRNIFLVFGNHDRRARKAKTFRQMFVNTSDYLEILSGDTSIILTHYPIEEGCWNRCRNGAWHLHGHTHGKTPSTKSKRLDVGVDNLAKYGNYSPEAYRPFSLAELSEYILSDQTVDSQPPA